MDLSKLVSWFAGICAAIIALFLLYGIMKDGIELAKGSGSGSIWKIVGKVLTLVIMIGFIWVVANGYSRTGTLGSAGETIGNKLTTVTNGVAQQILDNITP